MTRKVPPPWREMREEEEGEGKEEKKESEMKPEKPEEGEEEEEGDKETPMEQEVAEEEEEEDDDVDPLDAYMEGVKEEVKKFNMGGVRGNDKVSVGDPEQCAQSGQSFGVRL